MLTWRQRAKLRGEYAAVLADVTAQQNATFALGNVDLDAEDLTLARLKQKLGQPGLKENGKQGDAGLGWACGKNKCAIWATFPITSTQEIPESMAPSSLLVYPPPITDYPNISFDGVHLDDPETKLVKVSSGRGFKPPKGFHQVSWDKDWDIIWAARGGKITLLEILNPSLASQYQAEMEYARHQSSK